jgi:hypothetical protein
MYDALVTIVLNRQFSGHLLRVTLDYGNAPSFSVNMATVITELDTGPSHVAPLSLTFHSNVHKIVFGAEMRHLHTYLMVLLSSTEGTATYS